MDVLEAIAIIAAGCAAGAVNAVVGSGTLITFPVLIALGYQPLIANVSNNIGLVPGAVAGVHGYRRELRGQRRRAITLGVFSVTGAIAGAALLLVLPSSAFDAIVPILIAVALVLVVAQPAINRRLADRPTRDESAVLLRGSVAASGVYGGYFGAGQGILLMGILGIGLRDDLQRLNGLKNVLAGLVNFTAGLIFVFAAPHIDWGVVGLIAVGSIVGGVIGARYGRKLEPNVLRALIVVVGLTAIVRLLLD